jgi:hypothetical protein
MGLSNWTLNRMSAHAAPGKNTVITVEARNPHSLNSEIMKFMKKGYVVQQTYTSQTGYKTNFYATMILQAGEEQTVQPQREHVVAEKKVAPATKQVEQPSAEQQPAKKNNTVLIIVLSIIGAVFMFFVIAIIVNALTPTPTFEDMMN